MNRGIYATATGMSAMQKWMDVVTNNLANAGTTGFKRDTVAFNDVYVRELRSNLGYGPRVGSLGSGAVPLGQETVFERGSIAATNNPLDVALDSDRGLFAVERDETGQRLYTRDGSFRLSDDKHLVTRDGDYVLDEDGRRIQLGDGVLKIETDGSVTLDGESRGRIGVWDGEFQKLGTNLYTADSATTIDAPIAAGALEGSNVNSIEAMIEMIKINRIFELSQRSIQQQDGITGQLIQSLRDQ